MSDTLPMLKAADAAALLGISARKMYALAESGEVMTELYRHFDAAGRLLYVGISLSTSRRLAQHRISPWAEAVASVTIERYPTRAAALIAERQAIQSEHPIYNKAGKGRSKAKKATAYLTTTDPEESPLRRYFRERGYVVGKGRP